MFKVYLTNSLEDFPPLETVLSPKSQTNDDLLHKPFSKEGIYHLGNVQQAAEVRACVTVTGNWVKSLLHEYNLCLRLDAGNKKITEMDSKSFTQPFYCYSG